MTMTAPTRWWHPVEDDPSKVVCTLCPRQCHIPTGSRGFCFVRANEKGSLVLTTYGRSSGFCIDPIEKKPLNHFLPGTPVLSFGTAGCNIVDYTNSAAATGDTSRVVGYAGAMFM